MSIDVPNYHCKPDSERTPPITAHPDALNPPQTAAGQSLGAMPRSPCSPPSPEEWWATHAALLAEKMKAGGVKDFRISLTERGTYEFEVNPISEENAEMQRPR